MGGIQNLGVVPRAARNLARADLTHEPTSHATPGWRRVATLVALIVALMSCLMLMVAR